MNRSDKAIATNLADWASRTGKLEIPVARDRAVMAIADTIACMFAGSGDVATEAVLAAQLESGATGCSRIIGKDLALGPAAAAMVNGTAAHALDFDDNFIPATTHASAVLVPALFALADTYECAGADIIDAYIIGLELQARIGSIVNPVHYKAGWHATSTIGTIGTAGAAAVLLKLPADQIAHAMSIAFSFSSGSKLQFGTPTKPAHAGFAAHNAVMSALMARSGLTAQPGFLTEKWGFADLYADSAVNEISSAVEGLGDDWAIVSHGLMPKRFPCCGAAHKALDGVEALVQTQGIGIDDVEHVVAVLPEILAENLRFDSPKSASEARFSFSWPAMRLMQSGRLSLSDFTDQAIGQYASAQVGQKFLREKTDNLPTSADYLVTVKARLKDGSTVESAIRDVRGSIANPFSREELAIKFKDCLAWSGHTDQTWILDRLDSFDSSLILRDFFTP